LLLLRLPRIWLLLGPLGLLLRGLQFGPGLCMRGMALPRDRGVCQGRQLAVGQAECCAERRALGIKRGALLGELGAAVDGKHRRRVPGKRPLCRRAVESQLELCILQLKLAHLVANSLCKHMGGGGGEEEAGVVAGRKVSM
jgi:hypothetical protein